MKNVLFFQVQTLIHRFKFSKSSNTDHKLSLTQLLKKHVLFNQLKISFQKHTDFYRIGAGVLRR